MTKGCCVECRGTYPTAGRPWPTGSLGFGHIRQPVPIQSPSGSPVPYGKLGLLPRLWVQWCIMQASQNASSTLVSQALHAAHDEGTTWKRDGDSRLTTQHHADLTNQPSAKDPFVTGYMKIVNDQVHVKIPTSGRQPVETCSFRDWADIRDLVTVRRPGAGTDRLEGEIKEATALGPARCATTM